MNIFLNYQTDHQNLRLPYPRSLARDPTKQVPIRRVLCSPPTRSKEGSSLLKKRVSVPNCPFFVLSLPSLSRSPSYTHFFICSLYLSISVYVVLWLWDNTPETLPFLYVLLLFFVTFLAKNVPAFLRYAIWLRTIHNTQYTLKIQIYKAENARPYFEVNVIMSNAYVYKYKIMCSYMFPPSQISPLNIP